ncbi:MAG: hypothetical protein WD270_11410 [Acetobacterales bacterium]
MSSRPPDEAQMGRTLAETARLNSSGRRAGEEARDAVVQAAGKDDARAGRIARRNARIFIGAAVLIVLFLTAGVLLSPG